MSAAAAAIAADDGVPVVGGSRVRQEFSALHSSILTAWGLQVAVSTLMQEAEGHLAELPDERGEALLTAVYGMEDVLAGVVEQARSMDRVVTRHDAAPGGAQGAPAFDGDEFHHASRALTDLAGLVSELRALQLGSVALMEQLTMPAVPEHEKRWLDAFWVTPYAMERLLVSVEDQVQEVGRRFEALESRPETRPEGRMK